MSDQERKTEITISNKTTIFYSFAGIADLMVYQMFSFYIFNFYYTIVIGNIVIVSLGYIIWSIWNAFNDPLIGILSDRTNTKWGRRRPYIIGGIIPTLVILILLWTAPIAGDILVQFLYFIIIINLFDTFFTSYSLNQVALFPEMYRDLDERAKANNIVQIFNIVGLLFATLIPGFMTDRLIDYIGDPTEKVRIQSQFITTAILMAIIAAIFAFLFIMRGLKERKEYSKDSKAIPSFSKSIKLTFKNKSFNTYVLTNLAQWYIFGLIPIMNPYFLGFIIGVEIAIIQQIFLALIFISAIFFMILWRNYFSKKGAKKGHLSALYFLLIAFIPSLFIWEFVGAIILYVLLGFGFAGIMFGRDIVMSTIIDYDEIQSGLRREGAYYGVNALIIRLSTVFVALSIALVFDTVGWAVYDPTSVDIFILVGIRMLMGVFPIIVIALGILSFRRFPIDKQKYDEMKDKLVQIHAEKAAKTN